MCLVRVLNTCFKIFNNDNLKKHVLFITYCCYCLKTLLEQRFKHAYKKDNELCISSELYKIKNELPIRIYPKLT